MLPMQATAVLQTLTAPTWELEVGMLHRCQERPRMLTPTGEVVEVACFPVACCLDVALHLLNPSLVPSSGYQQRLSWSCSAQHVLLQVPTRPHDVLWTGHSCTLQLWTLPDSRVQLMLRQRLPNLPAGRGNAHLVEALTPTPVEARQLSGTACLPANTPSVFNLCTGLRAHACVLHSGMRQSH